MVHINAETLTEAGVRWKPIAGASSDKPATRFLFGTNPHYVDLSNTTWVSMSVEELLNFILTHGIPLQGSDKEITTMLDKLIRLYTAYMLNDVRSPMPHLYGPPGVGKSESAQQLADLLNVNLHIINASRISPLEVEGVQMPITNHDDGSMHLQLLHNTLWTQLQEGDIIIFDEFLRAFPEVYNGLLDILSGRVVAGYTLPKVFIMGASNSIATYDPALEDRLLHIEVTDIRRSNTARGVSKQKLIEGIGLNPNMLKADEMEDVIRFEVEPTYNMLDSLKGKGQNLGTTSQNEGHSVRNLIGQALLREVQSNTLKSLIEYNNLVSIRDNVHQYVVLLSGRKPNPAYVTAARKLVGNPKLTPLQARNLEMNLHLIEMEDALKVQTTAQKVEVEEDDTDLF